MSGRMCWSTKAGALRLVAAAGLATGWLPLRAAAVDAAVSNPKCTDLGYALELKIDPPQAGHFISTDGLLEVDVTFTTWTSGNPKVMDWTSDYGVDLVLLKAGREGHGIYEYDPASFGDSGLTTPNAGGNAISHISFCYSATSAGGGSGDGEPEQTPEPTSSPTDVATSTPTNETTTTPTELPSETPPPTQAPTEESTQAPTEEPTQAPTEEPTQSPTQEPTQSPTVEATETPTSVPSETPTPTEEATQAPTQEPIQAPTEEPTQSPTQESTQVPTEEPTLVPTEEPTQAPTEEPTQAPTEEPTQSPTQESTQAPTEEPTQAPTEEPTPSATPVGRGLKPNDTPIDEPVSEEPTETPDDANDNEDDDSSTDNEPSVGDPYSPPSLGPTMPDAPKPEELPTGEVTLVLAGIVPPTTTGPSPIALPNAGDGAASGLRLPLAAMATLLALAGFAGVGTGMRKRSR